MLEKLTAILKSQAALLKSKKALAAVAGILIAIVGRTGVVLPVEATTEIVGVVIAYILGQGLADVGKEAAKIDRGQDGGVS